MAEVLFRGKRIDNGEWTIGSLIRVDEEWQYILPPHTGASTMSKIQLIAINMKRIDPDTVGQYTGLTDKNGVKIFEYDIVTGFFNKEKIIGTIVYGSDAQFFTDRKGLYGIGLNNADDWLEVIGNIHDNPELLEVRDEVD